MARNPKQDANLKPFQKGELTSEEAKKRGRAGGVKSGESRRAKRDAKSAIRYLLDLAAKGKIARSVRVSQPTGAERLSWTPRYPPWAPILKE